MVPRRKFAKGWILLRVLELTYTAWDLEAFAQDCGWNGPPFRWDEKRRFLIRCELDAGFFHLYGPSGFGVGTSIYSGIKTKRKRLLRRAT